MVVLDCHFPLSCRQGYTLCCIHYVDNGTHISCISCRQLKLHYKFMYELTPPLCFAHSVCTHCAWKMDLQYFCYLMAIFGLHRFKQDMCGHTVILISFTMDFLNFCSEPMFWKGSKSKPQFYCNDMVNPMKLQQSCEVCNSAIWSHSEGEKSWLKSDSFPPSKKEIFLHTGKVPKKPQTGTNKLLKGLQNWWDGIYYCWMLDEKLVHHCMYQITWNGY
jgi:hypothetical protein